MKRMARIRVLAELSLAAIALVAHGRIPEPDTIVAGTVANAPSGRALEVQAVVDGATLASAEVASGTGAFLLRIPMDDGASPRLAGTAKANDRVRLFVVNTGTGETTEVLETREGGFEIPSGRGQVLRSAYSVGAGSLTGGDSDGDGMPDAWELAHGAGRNGHAGLSSTSPDGAADNDGDGRTNWEEYVAGTDPLDEDNAFGVLSIAVAGRIVTVTAGPGATGRRYSLMRTDVLGETADWKKIATAEATEDGGTVVLTWTATSEGGFFRVDVAMEE